jgi:hypothetical protein
MSEQPPETKVLYFSKARTGILDYGQNKRYNYLQVIPEMTSIRNSVELFNGLSFAPKRWSKETKATVPTEVCE